MIRSIPESTLDWLCEPENPAVASLTRHLLLKETSALEEDALWRKRNEYPPVAKIIKAMREDGSWLAPERDYKKYDGSLWQIHFLGELWADRNDTRLRKAADYAFSRQLPDGSWSSNGRAVASAPCLTANVARALARLGFEQDDRIARAIRYVADLCSDQGFIGCKYMRGYTLNGYCHMLTPKILLLLAEVPKKCWPDGARELRDACVEALADKEVFRCLPEEFNEFKEKVWPLPKQRIEAARDAFYEKHEPLAYRDKPGWLRFGYPLSYNSDALEALWALASVGESRRTEFEAALAEVEKAADPARRWTMRNSFNGKMIADVETKGQPSKWLTLRALLVLDAFE